MSCKDARYRKIITSSKWRSLRAVKMAKNPLCEDCLLHGKTVIATEVHHVVPVESAHSVREMEMLAYDYNNLRSLCHECHQNTHISMKSRSKEAVKQSNQLKKERFIDRFLSNKED